MRYTDELRLDMSGKRERIYIDAKQGDDASRFIRAIFTEHGKNFAANNTMSASIRCLKPDGKSVFNPATINTDGTVTAELTKQMLAVAGVVTADITLTDANGNVLSTVTFMIRVEPAPEGKAINSSNELLVLKELFEKADNAVNIASTIADKATETLIAIDESKESAANDAAAAEGSAKTAKEAALQSTENAKAAEESAANAGASAERAAASEEKAALSAEAAKQVAQKNGYFYFDIEAGHLIETRTDNVSEDLNFMIEEGRLILEYA